MPAHDRFLRLKQSKDDNTLRYVVTGIITYALVGYLNEFAAQNQVDREIDRPPLFDRGHELMSHVISPIYSNAGLIIFALYFALRWGLPYPALFAEYIWMLVLLFIVRVVIFSVTQFPPPSPNCSTRKFGDPIHWNVFNKDWKECLDLMYSGHTFHTVLICLFVINSKCSVIEKWVVVLLGAFEIYLVIAGRLHYTADVLVAILVTVLLFYTWPGVRHVLELRKSPPYITLATRNRLH